MNSMKNVLLASALGMAVIGCGGSSSSTPTSVAAPAPDPAPDPVMRVYEMNVVNLTASQPLSPMALVAHESGYSAFQIGEPATEGLEVLAEGGDNTMFISEADADEAVLQTVSGEGVLGPGANETLTVELEESVAETALFSAVTMLVNTNDAITAARGIDISALEVGERIQVTTIGYDAGTELNTELAGTIPGPADGGEGFNEVRDDLNDAVTGHAGVLTMDDGLAESVLTDIHRWDNPITRVTISRLE